MKSFTNYWPPAKANGHLAEAHARHGNIETARNYAKRAATWGTLFIEAREEWFRETCRCIADILCPHCEAHGRGIGGGR